MSLFTSIDLSKLPPPAVLDVPSYNELLDLWLDQFRALMPEYSGLDLESDPVRKLCQTGAYREMIVRQDVRDKVRSLLLAYAPYDVLVHLGGAWGLPPLPGEDADSYRQRIQLAPEALSTAGPDGAYMMLVKSASALVKDVRVLSPVPGAVELVILSTEGDGSASDDLLAAVLSAIQDRRDNRVRPLTDQVTAVSAEIMPYTVSAALEILPGTDLDTVIAAARAKCSAFVAASHALGLGVTESSLKAALTVEGVHGVTLSGPAAAGVPCTKRQAAHCTGLSLSAVTYTGDL